MNAPHDPLTDEERALAGRLARLGAPEGPPPSLDAKILAAAHRAVQHQAPVQRRRWPLALGAAASVVFAVGVAWQLRPGQDEARVYSEADFVRAPAAGGPSAAEELPVAVDSAEPAAQSVAPAPAEPPADLARGGDAEAAAGAAPQLADAAPAAAEAAPPSGEDTASEAKAVAAPPPPPAPPAPPEPPIVFDDPAAIANPAPASAPPPAANATARGTPAPARRAGQESAGDDASLDQVTVTGSRLRRESEGFSNEELDEDPPATADSPQVQRAWLQRIRVMVADGDLDGARASLGEFTRRYPGYPLPDDLRGLAP